MVNTLNTRTAALVTDMKELKDAQTNFKFAREALAASVCS
jgi:hypothetical protein